MPLKYFPDFEENYGSENYNKSSFKVKLVYVLFSFFFLPTVVTDLSGSVLMPWTFSSLGTPTTALLKVFATVEKSQQRSEKLVFFLLLSLPKVVPSQLHSPLLFAHHTLWMPVLYFTL